MAGSSFGTLFRVTTFGESHCKGVGCIVDGCPPGMVLSEADIQPQLSRRRPGQSRLTTPRVESDVVTILSGTEGGRTLGTPIALVIPNENVKPSDYADIQRIPRPGHADYTYHMKYGIHASSGGGRSSARETIGRVAAGAIAEKWLREHFGTEIVTFVSAVGTEDIAPEHLMSPSGRPWTRHDVDTHGTLTVLRSPKTGWRAGVSTEIEKNDEGAFVMAYRELVGGQHASGELLYDKTTPCYEGHDHTVYNLIGEPLGVAADFFGELDISCVRSNEVIAVRCPHAPSACRMASLIRLVKAEKDSTGGVLTTFITGVPIGLGEPVFDKLEAKLAHAMMSLPATKGFEIGSGFAGARLRGSQHNDMFVPARSAAPASSGDASKPVLLRTTTNHAGGTLGGISNGSPICFRVAIKPVSTISLPQHTAALDGTMSVLEAKGRHDPCVLPRAPPLVEAMAALVLMDAVLIQRSRSPTLHVLAPEVDEPHDGATQTEDRIPSLPAKRPRKE